MSQKINRIMDGLDEEFPSPKVTLACETPFQLLVATILSAQCKDERVNRVTRTLFKRYRTVADDAKADPPSLEQEIRSTGFYRMKAKNIIRCSQQILEQFEGKVPQTIEELITLPGVW
jgi:endonuclease III